MSSTRLGSQTHLQLLLAATAITAQRRRCEQDLLAAEEGEVAATRLLLMRCELDWVAVLLQ